MKFPILLLMVLLRLNTYSQSVFNNFLASIDSAETKAERTEVIAYYLPIMEEQGIPFIEGDTANFIYVGTTTGRGRMDREHASHGQSPKDIYVYPLSPRFRQELSGL